MRGHDHPARGHTVPSEPPGFSKLWGGWAGRQPASWEAGLSFFAVGRVSSTACKLSGGLVEGTLQGLGLTVREKRDRSVDVREDQGGPELEGCSDWEASWED